MNSLYKLVAKSPNYIRRFGLVHGLRLLYQIEGVRQLPKKSEQLRAFSIPGFDAPVFLRDCVGDHATFWQCLVMNQYDFTRFPQARRLREQYEEEVASSRAPIVIDCGGNIGLSVLWFASNFPLATIYVVEPEPSNLAVLRRNVERFGDRVHILEGGIWNQPGYLEIINPEAGPSAFRVRLTDHSGDPNSLKCYTIDQISAMAMADRILIVKLDIEGSQKDLFSTNTEWVERTGLITLELDDWLLPWQGTSRNFFKCLSQYPFDYLLNGESIFCFRDHTDQPSA